MDDETLELDSLAELRLEAEQGEPQPDLEEGDRLPIDTIETLPEVFQPRTHGRGEVVDRLFVETLSRELEPRLRVGLDPIEVYWTGSRWVLIDGHHRLEAYRACRAWGNQSVPVSVFGGPLEEAIRFSVEQNRKKHLQITRSEESDFAWRFLCLTRPTKDTFMEVTGQCLRQYRYMVKRFQYFTDEHPEVPLTELANTRWSALRVNDPFAEGEPEADRSTLEDKLAAKWAGLLRKHFGPALTRQPDAFARAIAEVNPGLPGALMESYAWSDVRNDKLDDWVAERDDPEF